MSGIEVAQSTTRNAKILHIGEIIVLAVTLGMMIYNSIALKQPLNMNEATDAFCKSCDALMDLAGADVTNCLLMCPSLPIIPSNLQEQSFENSIRYLVK